MTEEKSIIWLVDDNDRELRTNTEILQNIIDTTGHDDNVIVKGVIAYPRKEDYLPLLSSPLTVCFVLDQRLQDSKVGVDHEGIQLAQYLRRVDPIIPIYILTAFAGTDDFEGGEWSVENILPKTIFDDPDLARTEISRLLRRLDIHQKITEERDVLFQALLKKSIHNELTEDERKQMEDLDLQRLSPIVASDFAQRTALEETYLKFEHLLHELTEDDEEKNS